MLLPGPAEPPSGSGFGVNMGPVEPLPAPGHSNPRPSHIPLLFFLVAKCLWLSEQVGCVYACVCVRVCECVFSPLIFTHKMCISRTKAAMIGPLAPLNFLPICRGISCNTPSSLFQPFVIFLFLRRKTNDKSTSVLGVLFCSFTPAENNQGGSSTRQ